MNFPLLRLAFAASLFTASFAHAAGSDWPQWLGPKRDGHAAAGSLTLTKLPAAPAPVWKINIGGGFSSPVVSGDTVVIMAGRGEEEVAFGLNAADGKERWSTPISSLFADEWGPGPRATPVIDGDRVYVLSCSGEFRCLNLKDGKVVWGKSFEKDFGVAFLGSKAREGTASRRGNNGSPVVDGDLVFVPAGNVAGATVIALDKLTGKVAWKAGHEEAAYSALQVATLGGHEQVVMFAADSLSGFDRATGKLLWSEPLKTNAKRHASTPVILGDMVVVNSHTFGTVAFRIEKAGDGCKSTRAWVNPEMKINLGTLVEVGGNLYGHGPAKNFVCLDSNTGKARWTQPGFGKDVSSTVALDDKTLLALTDMGELVLIAVDPTGYKELGRTQVCGKTWSTPAIANGSVYVREGLTDGFKLSRWKF